MKKILLGVAVAALLALLVGNVYAQCCPCGFTPGFWKHNIGVYLDYANGAFSAFEGGPLDGEKCNIFLDTIAGSVDLEALYVTMSTGGGGAIAQARADAANYLNELAGYGPFAD